MKKVYFLSLFIAAILFSGCAQRVKVHTLAPAKIDRASMTKKIAVMHFKNDSKGLSSKIETAMATKIIDGKPYFTVLSRSDIDKILQEQRLQYSGLIDESTAVEVGNLIGVQAIITGEISDASSSFSYFRKKRIRCIDKKCKETQSYTVPCRRGFYSISAQLKMIDVEKGDIIHADTFKKSTRHSHCSDENGGLPSESHELNILSNYVAKSFVSKLYPTPMTFDVELLEDPDVNFTDEQEDLLEYSLEYIETGRYKKAEEFLSKLLNSSNDKSYVAAYNLGVVKEVQGQYNHAQQLYALADSLKLEPIEPIDVAVVRIQLLLSNKQAVENQINR